MPIKFEILYLKVVTFKNKENVWSLNICEYMSLSLQIKQVHFQTLKMN